MLPSRRRTPLRFEERCRLRKVLLDTAAAELVEVCRALPDVVAVYAYGSYARDQIGITSDLDALVIRETMLPRYERQDDIRSGLRARGGFDLLVVTPDEYMHIMPQNSVGRHILAEAKLLARFRKEL